MGSSDICDPEDLAAATAAGSASGPATLSWWGIIRLGLVQASLGAIVVLMTSAINRVMVVELALPAIVPGALIALHYLVQVSRPRWGYGSDKGGRRTPWIIGGMAVLGLGGSLAALAVTLIPASLMAGLALATLAFLLVGVGVGAAGTSLLVLLSSRVTPQRRAGAATTVWLLMIAGFAITAPLAGHFLEPYTPLRLLEVTGTVCILAVALSAVAIAGVEGPSPTPDGPREPTPPFAVAFREVWSEPRARQFALFIFVSMMAYSGQELVLEPFGGIIFGLTPGQTTKLAGLQHGGVLVGMIVVFIAATVIGGPRLGSLRGWTMGGCVASALILAAIAAVGLGGHGELLRPLVGLLGIANGAFAVSAIGSMMAFVHSGTKQRAGTRMGLWGASQAVAFGVGGVIATGAASLLKLTLPPVDAYAAVFVGEATLFIAAALLALRLDPIRKPASPPAMWTAPSPREISHGRA